MARILIVAPRYDFETRVTSDWATNLSRALAGSPGQTPKHICTILRGRAASVAALVPAMSSADFLVFFGHGEATRLIGQGGLFSSSPTLVDTGSVSVLRGVPTYTVCCRALQALGAAYAALYPHGGFVGYRGPFFFSDKDPLEFGNVANSAAMSFVNGSPHGQVAADLKQAWGKLSERFCTGDLRDRPYAFLGIAMAAANERFVGAMP